MIRFASVTDVKPLNVSNLDCICHSKKHVQLFGIHFFILLLKVGKDFASFIFCGIRSHIFVPRLVIDSFSMLCRT